MRKLLRSLIAITGILDPEPMPIPVRAATRERQFQEMLRRPRGPCGKVHLDSQNKPFVECRQICR